MSTKTTFKRIALVAVAALGMGVLSTTAANAATVYTTAITVTTNKAPVAGANGSVVTHTLRFSTSTSAAQTVEPNVILSSKPAGSTMAYQAEGGTTTVPSGKFEVGNAAADTTDATEGQGADLTTASEAGYTNFQAIAYLHAYYDLPGTYTYTIFDDQGTDDGVFNGTDFGTTISVVVGATGVTATYTGTASAINASSVVSGANGSLVKIGLTSGGVAASPDNAGGVRVTLSGPGVISKLNNVGSLGATTTYILGANDFNGSGFAWVNITSATAQTLTVTLSGTGSMASSFTAPSPVVLSFVAAVASTTAPIIGMGAALATSGVLVGSAATATADGTATANKAATAALVFQTGKSSATVAAKDLIIITDTNGVISGLSGVAYDILVTESDSDNAATYNGTFSVTPVFNSGVTGQSFEVANLNGFGLTVSSATAAATTATVTSVDVIRSVYGGAHSFTVNVDNQFGANMSNIAVSAAIAGRNSAVMVASAITNASGNAVLTYTDVSTSTTSLVDTLTFTAAAGVTDTASVTYTSLAGLGVTTVLATTTQTSATTGADLTTITPFAIAAGSDGVEAGAQTVTITVKDVNGVGIAGVPVTVSVAGTTAAVLSTKRLVYTGALGTITSSVYAWSAPVYGTLHVVTVTAGGVSDTVNTYWGQANADHTRTFTATSSGRIVTVVAMDRLGNPVFGAAFTARITSGDGFFGTGTNTASGTTDATGTMKFITLESPTDQVVSVQAGGSATYAQTDAPAGNISSADPLDVFTAATVGTATTAETGVGATFAPAGINTVTLTIKGAPSATEAAVQAAADAAAEAIDAGNNANESAVAAAEAAEAATAAAEEAGERAVAAAEAAAEAAVEAANAATDAANEALDAANAATDAANASAEAADAATAAAQDAADAVAALSVQVTEMIDALKKQITSLTNLVIKIQKKVKA